jgi:HK97 gp10 family phage protein
VQGLDEIVANMRRIPELIAGKGGGPIRKALFEAAKVVREDAKRRVPVGSDDDAHLRDNIIMRRDRNPPNGVAEHYSVTVRYRPKKYKNTRRNRQKGRVGGTYQNFGEFYYWRFVEFGTSKMPARPFLRPAFESNKQAMLDTFKNTLSDAVRTALQSAGMGWQ